MNLQRLIGLIVVSLLCLTACTARDLTTPLAPRATPVPTATVDATKVEAQLGRASTLREAAAQCASALAGDPDAALVRVEAPATDHT